MIDFEKWWHETGSGIIPLSNHDQEEHAMRVSQAAWEAASEQLRTERDKARRRVCEMSLELGKVYRRVGGKTVEVTTPEGCAEIMRWDCFKEETQ